MENRVAICIPTYNEKENIIKIIEAVHAELATADVFIVDDNSPDKTAEIVADYAKEHPFVSVKVRPAKEGLGAAYIDGFRTLIERGYDFIIQMDADFSHQPKYLPKMLQKAKEGFDVVLGSRYVKGGGTRNWPLLRRVISRGGSFYASTVLGTRTKDVTCGYKCWRAGFLKRVITVPIVFVGFGFQIEMSYRTKLCGGKVFEVPIIFPDREDGVSKMSGKIFKEALFGVWKLKGLGKKLIEG